MPNILVAESQASARLAIRRFLGGRGHDVRLAPESADDACSMLRDCDLLIADPHWLRILREAEHDLLAAMPVVLLLDTASESMSETCPRLTRPIDFERLAQLVDTLVLAPPAPTLAPILPAPSRYACVHAGGSMAEVLERARKLAGHDLPVLIEGETGTGKELVARHLHASGPRAAHPFVGIHCGAIPHELLESELFGHLKGSFTDAARDRTGLFEAAGEGTVFLDEIGELPISLQPKLLRALQEREFNPVGSTRPRALRARVVAATQADLASRAAGGTFRADLLHRVAGAVLRVPPLRDRPEDLEVLVPALLGRAMGEGAPSSAGLAMDAFELLRAHPWPGNVRELENVLRHALVLADGRPIGPEEIRAAFVSLPGADPDRGVEGVLAGFIARSLARGEHPRVIRDRIREWTEPHLSGTSDSGPVSRPERGG